MPIYVPPAAAGAAVVAAGYTPALVGPVIGTGGTPQNAAIYTWIGGANSGDIGTLTIQGVLEFGTSGQTFIQPTTTIGLPSGWVFDDAYLGAATVAPIAGNISMYDTSASTAWYGLLVYSSTTTVRLMRLDSGSANLFMTTPSTTLPFTWASGDQLIYAFTIRAQRT